MQSEEPNPRPDEAPPTESLRLRRRYARLAGAPTEGSNDWDSVWRRDARTARKLLHWMLILAAVGAAVVAALRR